MVLALLLHVSRHCGEVCRADFAQGIPRLHAPERNRPPEIVGRNSASCVASFRDFGRKSVTDPGAHVDDDAFWAFFKNVLVYLSKRLVLRARETGSFLGSQPLASLLWISFSECASTLFSSSVISTAFSSVITGFLDRLSAARA